MNGTDVFKIKNKNIHAFQDTCNAIIDQNSNRTEKAGGYFPEEAVWIEKIDHEDGYQIFR